MRRDGLGARGSTCAGWKFPFALQLERFPADVDDVRTPRGLLATLGATLSMVAAAACVLFFTSTLVAVNGWPGLSAPPNGGPVALAPVERTVKTTTSGSSGSAGAPIVLGAPAAPSTPAVQVGVGSTPSATTTPAGTAGGSQRLDSGAAPETTGPTSTQETTSTSSPVTIGPIPAATEPATTAPAVQSPASTPVTTSAPTTTEQTSQTSDKPSERRVALSTPVAQDDAPTDVTSEDDTQVQEQTSTTQESQARRSFVEKVAGVPARVVKPVAAEETTTRRNAM